MPRRPSRARGWRNWRWAPGRPRRRGSAIQLHRRRLRRRPCAFATTLARAARRSRAGFSASGLRGPASERPPRGSLPPKGHIPPEALLDWATPVPRPRHVPSRLRRKLLLQPAPLRHLLADPTPVLEHVPRRIVVDGLEKFCLPHTTELCGGPAGECQKLLPDMPYAPRSQQKGFALCGVQQAEVLRESHLDLNEQGKHEPGPYSRACKSCRLQSSCLSPQNHGSCTSRPIALVTQRRRIQRAPRPRSPWAG